MQTFSKYNPIQSDLQHRKAKNLKGKKRDMKKEVSNIIGLSSSKNSKEDKHDVLSLMTLKSDSILLFHKYFSSLSVSRNL